MRALACGLLFVGVSACSDEVTTWTASIAGAGGFVAGDGVELRIPAGALDGPAEITITVVDTPAPQGWQGHSRVYRFEPAGLRFARPATLRIDASDAPASSNLLWLSDGTVEIVESERAGSGFTGQVEHFSEGLVASPTVASSDAGSDVPPSDSAADAGVDGSSVDANGGDGGLPVGAANVGCWNDEIIEVFFESAPGGPTALVAGNGSLYTHLRNSTELYRRVDDVWTSESLVEEVSLEPPWGLSSMIADAGGSLHFLATIEEFELHYLRHGAVWETETIPLQEQCRFIESTDLALQEDEVHAIVNCYDQQQHCKRDPGGWSCELLATSERGATAAQLVATSTGLFHTFNVEPSTLSMPESPQSWDSLSREAWRCCRRSLPSA